MKNPLALDSASLPVADRLPSGRFPTLWVDGDPGALCPPLVALVGTRDADARGEGTAYALAAALAEAGLTVLSGGALGIDASAHLGAVDARGRSVVALPCGLAHWYPARHEELYGRLLGLGGALVSALHPDTPPSRWTFPRRNALVAALADVLVVVQAPVSSGALMTAELALRLGRRVLAVPYGASDRRGLGCLRLLRAGAGVCTGAEDVRAALARRDGALFLPREPLRERPPAARTRAPSLAHAHAAPPEDALDPDARLVLDTLRREPLHLDELSRLCGFATPRLQRSLLTLTLAGLCEDRGGCTFARP
ncbi:MAG: DNA-processing protein DprA [Deltaproteobacteria bacterium]|nr:DNA-processing protein DprA [Deltaproteobacteria bacterium]